MRRVGLKIHMALSREDLKLLVARLERGQSWTLFGTMCHD